MIRLSDRFSKAAVGLVGVLVITGIVARLQYRLKII